MIKGLPIIWKTLTQSWGQAFTYSNRSKNLILEKKTLKKISIKQADF